MDPELLQLVEYLKHQRLVVDYVYVSAAAVLFYEYLLTVGLEISFIWCSPWGYTKVLFLLTRYVPFIETFLLIYNQLVPNVSEHACTYTHPITSWLILIGMDIAEVMLAVRTWAVWNRDTTVGVGLAILLLGALVPQFIFLNRFNNSFEYAPGPYLGFRGCLASGATHTVRDIWVEWVILVVVEGAFFVLMVMSAYKAYRYRGQNTLLEVVHRDGIVFYAYILCITIANVVVIAVLPSDLVPVFSPLAYVLFLALAARVIFNIKSMGRTTPNGLSAELNHPYPQTGPDINFINYHSQAAAAPMPRPETLGGSSPEDIEMSPRR